MNNIRIENFELNDYKYVSGNGIPVDGESCMQIAIDRNLVDPSDTSQTMKDRMSVLADMDTARVTQSQVSSFIKPSLNACVLTENTMRLYNSNSGANKIDPKTCLMSGETVNNEVIYNQLEPVKAEFPITPKGCMLNLENISQGKFDKMIDDAYQIKNYGYLKQKKDYEQAMIDITEQNEELKIRANRAEEINRQYAQQYNIQRTKDDITNKCETRYTDWQDVGGWSYNYLDRHNVQCKENEILSEFELQTSTQPNAARYRYRCCKIDSVPIPKKLKENVSSSFTPFQNSLNWNTMSLVSHVLQCPNNGNNVNVLKGFKLEPKYINQLESAARYNTSCSSFNTVAIPNRRIATQCRVVKTRPTDGNPTFDVLGKHNVSCKDGEGIVNAGLKTDGTNIYYEYACCKPVVVEG